VSYWAVVLPKERYQDEWLYHRDTVELAGLTGPAAGDGVVLVVDQQVVALGRVRVGRPVVVEYTHRLFDAPQPADPLALDAVLTRLEPAAYRALADRVGPPPAVSTWLVSVDLPIEASSPAEAVRRFWTYVMELGPSELPAFVWPSGDELAMQAYVLGVQANLDPEEDDEETALGEAGG
jgi:hypothetical protein